MLSPINKETLKRLAKLARIELDPKEEEKLLKDLGKILNHFKELQELDTSEVAPMAGGTSLKNVFREDSAKPDEESSRGISGDSNKGAGVEAFPEHESGYLKIPPVFNGE